MKLIKAFLIVAMIATLFVGCAAGANDLTGTPDGEGEVAGFWNGLWHGFISPVTFIISLFSDKVDLYEVHNNGGWYNFGFMLGISVILGGGGRGSGSMRKRRRD